jgi:hypothetical protein
MYAATDLLTLDVACEILEGTVASEVDIVGPSLNPIGRRLMERGLEI